MKKQTKQKYVIVNIYPIDSWSRYAEKLVGKVVTCEHPLKQSRFKPDALRGFFLMEDTPEEILESHGNRFFFIAIQLQTVEDGKLVLVEQEK